MLRSGTELRAGSGVQTAVKDSTADISLVAGTGGQATVRIYTNSYLNLIRLDFKQVGRGQSRDIRLGVAQGQIRVSLDGLSEYAFEIIGGKNPMRLVIPRNDARPQETVFVFGLPGTLTVLKGAIKASAGDGPERLIRAGEQLRSDADEVTRVPTEAPELKLGP